MARRKTFKMKNRKMAPKPKEVDFFDGSDSLSIINYEDGAAELPEWCGNNDPAKDYPDVEVDVKIWSPITDDEERSMPNFMSMAKTVLTCAQVDQGVPENEAMENSCSGYAEQYISNVLHDSTYLMDPALNTLMRKEIPPKLSARWTAVEKNLFEEGLVDYKKDFDAIRLNLLPHKTTKDVIEYYYTWKRSKQVKGLTKSRARPFLRRRARPKSLIIGSPTDSGIITRGRLAAKEDNSSKPARIPVSRKDVYMSVKRKRKSTKQPRVPAVEA